MRPTLELPDLDEDVAGGQFDRDFEILAVGVLHGHQRQGVEIVHRIAFLLPSVGIEELAEIALLIEQPEADQGIVLVAGRFQMVAGENAEAAGIDRQALGEAVFGGEIGDQFAVGGRGGLAHARVVGGAGGAIQGQVAGIGGGLLQRGLGNAAQHRAPGCIRNRARARDRGGGTETRMMGSQLQRML